MTDRDPHKRTDDIAIVGMAIRVPGASTLEGYWENICNGVESVVRLDDSKLAAAGINPDLIANPDYVKVRALLDNVDQFDAGFFGFTPRDADTSDPQQRVFLEICWEALENAGYDPERYESPIGVFAGSSMNTYLLSNLLQSRKQIQDLVGSYQVSGYNIIIGNDKDYLATRVCYKLNLKGPGICVQSACSTSLVAVCQAVESLQSGKCTMALAGGVSISFPQERGYLYEEGGMASADGHCRPFDEDASGTVFGSGAAVVLLKRIRDAIADGDTIHAVIKGVGINNDGSQKVSYMAPSVDGQAAAVAMALSSSGVDPSTIGYVEAHGTATPLGDPIEVAGLTKAYQAAGANERQYCAIGSVKSNIGHVAEASGAAGLIKTVLALKYGQIPPTVHYRNPNPLIDFDNSPFYVAKRLSDWVSNSWPRRAGVSSFGVGGTNTHVILEEAPKIEPFVPSTGCQILTLSARTPTALDSLSHRLSTFLTANPELDMASVSQTLQLGRKQFSNRRAVVCSNARDASERLSGNSQTVVARKVHTAFLFPGQGSQHANMGRELYENYSTYRSDIDACCEMLEPELAIDLRTLLYPADSNIAEAEKLLTETRYTQPALFVTEYALAMLWMDWGILPEAMIGHSVGEYAAATLAGVFDLPDVLKIIAARGRLMQSAEPGSMLAVRKPAVELQFLLPVDISIAALNAPSLTVVSGPSDSINLLFEQLTDSGIACSKLHTSHAFHSAMMDPILADFRAAFDGVNLSAPEIPFISNSTGTWITPEESSDPEYWVRHIRESVNFSAGIAVLLEDNDRLLLEVGPSNTLATLARQNAVGRTSRIFSSSPHIQNSGSQAEYLLNTVGQLWAEGASPDWSVLHSEERRQRIALPTYPFERKRHWVEPVNVYQNEIGD